MVARVRRWLAAWGMAAPLAWGGSALAHPSPDFEERGALTVAAAAEPSVPQAEFCAPGAWDLDGASVRDLEGNAAAFSETWAPQIDRIAACLDAPGAARACLEVRGRYDHREFSQEVVRAFGSRDAAQAARGRGRSAMVVQALLARGVGAAQVRESPPAPASWRGVSIRLVPDCLPEVQTLSDEDRALLAEAKAILERERLRAEEQAAAEEEARRRAAEAARARAPEIETFAGAGLHGIVGTASSGTAVASLLRIEVGARHDAISGRVGVGGALSQREAQRNALEAHAAVDYRILPWLEAGAIAGVRYGFPAVNGPWIERSWFAGVEAGQHLLSFDDRTHLIVREALLPLGRRSRRGEIDGDRLLRIPSTDESLLRFEIGLSLRREL